jgi:membrane-bound lytic murein transglycosylase
MIAVILAGLFFAGGTYSWAEFADSRGGSNFTSSDSATELQYKIAAIKACLGDAKTPGGKKPREYKRMEVLADNGECKRGSNNSAQGASAPVYQPVSVEQLPMPTGTAEDFKNLKAAIKSQHDECAKAKDLDSQSFSITVNGQELKFSKRKYCLETNAALSKLAESSNSYEAFMESAKGALNWYLPTACTQKPSLATGYYHPKFKVYHDPSQAPDPKTMVPILKKPLDHRYVKVQKCEPGVDDGYKSCQCIGNCAPQGQDRSQEVIQCPYLDRELLEKGLAGDKSLVLGWADAYDLTDGQLEGSWEGVLPDGSIETYATNGNNGHPNLFLSTINYCIAQKMKDPNETGRNWEELKNNALQIHFFNTNYTFAKSSAGDPKGTSGAVLHANAGIAVDPGQVPLGAAVLFDIAPRTKSGAVDPSQPRTSRMAMAADTGSAIKGACRIDVFTGSGPEGKKEAQLRHSSWLYLGIVK